MIRLPSFHGELGLKLLNYVPQVHYIASREPVSLEIEEGEEALFRDVRKIEIIPRPLDYTRHGAPPDLRVPAERFVPAPYTWEGLGVPEEIDVVLCPRWRSYGAEKNWHGWVDLKYKLRGLGLSLYSAGAPDSSLPLDTPASWNAGDRFLDASIQAMRTARLVVATDSGLAHLAIMCGAPLLVVTYRGLVAPGPVIDSKGREAQPHYWRAGYDPKDEVDRFKKGNHTGSMVERIDGWEDPAYVSHQVRELLA